ncbi:PAS domain S-box protein [Lutibacter sp. B2]|nr:PAS domain S-box protein [Lutibacter sp. B2]
MWLKKGSILFVCILLIFSVFIEIDYAQNNDKKSVLVLQSYDYTNEWVKRREKGVEEVLNSDHYKIHSEYMDSMNFYEDGYMDKLYELYKEKFENKDFDIIICCDNAAFNFMLKYRDDLFPNIPVVGCGINGTQKEILDKIKNHKHFKAIYESLDIIANIELALKLHPNTKHLVFIIEKYTIGKELRKSIEEKAKNFRDVIFIEEKNIEEVNKKINKLPEDSVVFFMSPKLEREKGVQVIGDIVNKKDLPMYSFWDTTVGAGVIGGQVVSAKDQGRKVGRITKKILDEQDCNSIYKLCKNQNQYMFDYKQMKKYNIDYDDVPQYSVFMNVPNIYYKFSKIYFNTIIVSIMTILMIIIYALVINISKRDKAEEKLKEQIKFKKVLMETIPSAMFYKNKEGKYIGCNKAYAELLGVEKSKIINCVVKEVFDPYHGSIYEKIDRRLIKSGGIQRYEEKIPNKNGHTRDVIFNKATYANEKGEIEGIIGIIGDITERKNMEKSLRESEERYRILVESIPYTFVIIDNDKIKFVNEAGLKLVAAKDKEEIIGRPWTDFIHASQYEKIKEKLKIVKEQHRIVTSMERKLIRLDGRCIYIEVMTMPIPQEGEIKQLCVIKDITFKKRNEKLRKKIKETEEQEKLRTEFFSNLSHELRTPLNVILGSVQLIESEIRNEKDAKRINVLKQNCYRLLRMINGLIDITKIDAGYFKINKENYNIVNIIENIVLSVVEYVEQKKLVIQFDTDVEEKIIACDPDALERIMLNLISNSIKFSNPGDRITVNVYDQGEEVCIIVKDTGIGIPKNQIKEIFKRFKQVDKSFRRNHEGSGIGLSLVEALVKMHGGSIEADSVYGEGTEFIIHLPADYITQEKTEIKNRDNLQTSVERINVEFSDIYN